MEWETFVAFASNAKPFRKSKGSGKEAVRELFKHSSWSRKSPQPPFSFDGFSIRREFSTTRRLLGNKRSATRKKRSCAYKISCLHLRKQNPSRSAAIKTLCKARFGFLLNRTMVRDPSKSTSSSISVKKKKKKHVLVRLLKPIRLLRVRWQLVSKNSSTTVCKRLNRCLNFSRVCWSTCAE